MALALSVGSRVTIIKGSHKGKSGYVKLERGVKVVELDNGVVLYGISDSNVKKS